MFDLFSTFINQFLVNPWEPLSIWAIDSHILTRVMLLILEVKVVNICVEKSAYFRKKLLDSLAHILSLDIFFFFFATFLVKLFLRNRN